MNFPSQEKKILFLCGLAGLFIITTLFVGCFWQSNNVNSENDVEHTKFSQQQNINYYSSQRQLCRGTILDRTGAILAISQKEISLFARPSELPQFDNWLTKVSEILNLDHKSIKKALALKQDVVCIKEGISEEEGLKLKDMHIRGLEVREEYKRVYPYGSMASPVLGFVDNRGRGLCGIEYTYDNFLNRNNFLKNHLDTEELTLTIEKNIQLLAESELDLEMKKLKADKGCFVIMGIKNGEILALASRPSWEPERFWNLPTTSIINYSLQDNVDCMLLAPLLNWMFERRGLPESVTQNLDKKIHKCKWLVLDKNLILWSPLSEKEFNLSCYAGLSRDLLSLGFGRRTGIDLPDEGQGKLYSAQSKIQNYLLDRINTASPIQTLRAFSALINGNTLVKPHLALEGPEDFLSSESPNKNNIKIPWITGELMLQLKEKLAVKEGPSIAHIGLHKQFGQILQDSPAQVTALGFWPDRSPEVSYILLLEGVKIDPRERRGTLGGALMVAKQACDIPLKDDWQLVKSHNTQKKFSKMSNLK
jgi:stage V sporulation protein D (sporulation-specific penicillin-binding protein)